MRCLVLFVLCLPPAVAGADDLPKPQETRSQAGLTTEVQRLRKEVEALKAQVDRMQRAIDADRSAPRPDRLLADQRAILAHFKTEKATAWKEAHGKIRELRRKLAAALKKAQDRYTRAAKLDEAVAVRDAIRALKEGARNALPDPGTVSFSGPSRVLLFRVTGADRGPVWGTDIYTNDSSLATAAVHCGALKMGQTGIVKVTTIPDHTGYAGSTQHGITSHSWSTYPGFRVEPLSDEDEETADDEGAEAVPPAEEPAGRPARSQFNGSPLSGGPQFDYPDSTVAESQPAVPPSLPADARQQIERFETAATQIRKEARQKVAQFGRETIAQLKPLQDAHTRAGRLDEAVAIRDLIRKLAESVGAKTDEP
jgi:hypothetical protein